MRIAFDHQAFYNDAYGGIARYFVALAGQLLGSGQEVRVFAPLHRNRYASELPSGIVRGRRLDRDVPHTGWIVRPLNHAVARHAIRQWQPDVVHETYYSPWRLAPETCPTVVTVHDMIHELFREWFPARDVTTRAKRLAVARADHVICVSERTRRDLMEVFGTSEEKLSVVHHGPVRFPTDEVRYDGARAATRPYLLYVGDRGGYKNFSGLASAIASSAHLSGDFDIVAFGGGAFTLRERRLIAELGFHTGRVRQSGGDDAALGRAYDGAAAFVFPSLYEGFGLPPLEAMAHRCPVVSSNSGAMPEVIGDAGEYFDPRHADDAAAAIERVVYSPSRANELRALGQVRLGFFSWDRCAARTLAVYRSVAGPSVRRPRIDGTTE